MWEEIYRPFIDLIEKKLNILKTESIITFRNQNFAFKNEIKPRIADLIIINELEKKISKSSSNNLIKQVEKIEDQYSEVKEKEDYILNITFVFTNKKIHPVKLFHIIKLADEVQKYSQLLHKKEFKQYAKIIPQIIFISLFGFEISIEAYLKDNLHGKIKRNISIMVVPPIKNKIWNNYLLDDLIEGNREYEKHKWGFDIDDYKNLRDRGAVNQNQVNNMEAYYKDLKFFKELVENNYKQLNFWQDLLSIKNSSKILDIENSRKLIKELLNE